MGRDGKGSVGFIGIGTMGREMVRNLLRAGHAVRAFDLADTAIADVVKGRRGSRAEPGGRGARPSATTFIRRIKAWSMTT